MQLYSSRLGFLIFQSNMKDEEEEEEFFLKDGQLGENIHMWR